MRRERSNGGNGIAVGRPAGVLVGAEKMQGWSLGMGVGEKAERAG